MASSDMEDFDWEDDFEWLDAEIAEELEASKASVSEHHSSSTSSVGKVNGVDKKALFKFISSLQQMEYNFYGRLAKSCDYAFIKERVDSNAETAHLIAKHLGYKSNNLSDIYYFNILLRQIAFIETSAREGGASFNAIIKDSGDTLLKEISSINTEGVIYLEDELSSNDISLHIKSALLPYALYYEAFIQKVSYQNRNDLEKYILMIVSMAKDISTRWQKNNTTLNKAITFTTSLPIVARFCMQYTESYINDKIQSALTSHVFEGKDIFTAIEKYDAGFGDYETLKVNLIDRINSAVDAEIDIYISTKWRKDMMFPRDQVKLIASEKLYDVWVECCKQEVFDFKRLGEPEQRKYIKDNAGVMNTGVFFESLSGTVKDVINDIFAVNINWKELEKGVREKFSMYWGVSDAIYKNS